MGLAERRAVEQFKNDSYPAWKKQIDEAAGFPVEVEVAWETLGVAGYAEQYETFFSSVYFQPLVGALNAITIDQLGRDALRDGLKKVVIRNENEGYGRTAFSFAEGVLTIDHRPETNVDDVRERREVMRGLLEENL